MTKSEDSSFLLTLFFFFAGVIVFIVALAAGGCNADADSTRTLENSGYTEVKLKGGAWFSCGEDVYATQFTAKNPKGSQVSGVVCCGILKSCTVRFLWPTSYLS